MRSHLKCQVRCTYSNDCYWKLIDFLKSEIPDSKRRTPHHILLRSLYPEFSEDPANIVNCSRLEHLILHELAARAFGGKWSIAYNYTCNCLIVDDYTPDSELISEAQKLSASLRNPEERRNTAIKCNIERFSKKEAREAQAEVMRRSNEIINSKSRICEFCDREVSLGNYALYHGVKCKFNPEPAELHECPYCLRKSRSLTNLKRYHFENCKKKPHQG